MPGLFLAIKCPMQMGLSHLGQQGEQRGRYLRENAEVREQELNNVVHVLNAQREHGEAELRVKLCEKAPVHHARSQAK